MISGASPGSTLGMLLTGLQHQPNDVQPYDVNHIPEKLHEVDSKKFGGNSLIGSAAVGNARQTGCQNLRIEPRGFGSDAVLWYLQRNPNDPPDTDYSGYNFWLTKLNQFNGHYIAAEMVSVYFIHRVSTTLRPALDLRETDRLVFCC